MGNAVRPGSALGGTSGSGSRGASGGASGDAPEGTPEFWNDLSTEKSWLLLQELVKEFDFVLIGGWAVFLWTNGLKSKDVDIVVRDYAELDKLRTRFGLKKNDRLKKYEFSVDEVSVDVYVPYYSQLIVPPHELIKRSERVNGITVVEPHVLLVLKQAAELGRRETVKGVKDALDLVFLLRSQRVNLKKYRELLREIGKKEFLDELISVVKKLDSANAKYLGLNLRELAVWKKRVLTELRGSNPG